MTYEQLHKKQQQLSIIVAKNEFVLDFIENKNPVLVGARYYLFKK